DDFFAGYTAEMQAKRDRLSAGLADAGLDVLPTQGTYFASCDITSIGETNGIDFCLALPERAGVVAVPSMVFFDNQDEGASIIRFAFCKKDEVIDEAVTRLKASLS
ncbi:MAG: aminotransferase class I/II-fold pyridoxal phosphate-dependent enzyme, partial [Actinobacteria bacterium]|nr:aminotransferase class I/II-fold pyridoxal phosphate-dependent enzyme [Actinomycetota bacterium]